MTPLIQDEIPAAMLVVTQNPTFSQSWNGGVMGDLVPVEEHLLRRLSRAGVLIKCCLLFEEDPPDLVQSFLRAITSMTLLSALVGWVWLGRLFAQRVNVETKDRATIVGITWLPQLPFLEHFGGMKHFCTKNTDSELSYKYSNIQSEYVGNLDKLKLFRKRIEAFDMFDPFLIPTWIDPDAISVLDCWDNRKHDGINLTKHLSKLLLEHMCAWQRDTFDWCTDEDNLTSTEWVKELLTNSCDFNLVKHIEEKFDQLFEYEQGGITYVKIALDEMFTMSNMVITLLQKFLK